MDNKSETNIDFDLQSDIDVDVQINSLKRLLETVSEPSSGDSPEAATQLIGIISHGLDEIKAIEEDSDGLTSLDLTRRKMAVVAAINEKLTASPATPTQ